MRKSPLISVVLVSSRSFPEKIEICLTSLLNQSLSRDLFEVIVVDSGSGEMTLDYITDLQKEHSNLNIIIPGEGNIGPARGRNLGFSRARGDILAFTDDDIELPKDWLLRIQNAYEKYPAVAGVGGMTLPPESLIKRNIWACFEKKMYLQKLKKEGEYFSETRDEHPAYSGNISYRRDIFLKVGGFNEEFKQGIYGEDGDLKEKILKFGFKLAYIPVIATHHCEFTFLSFRKKEEKRGLSILKYLIDHGIGKPSRFSIFLKLLLSPLSIFYYLRVTKNLTLAFLSSLALLYRQVGKLKYYGEV